MFHDLLAQADLCVGDSQSVAIESALLGVPTIRLSGFTGRHFTLEALEDRYGLIRNFHPGEEPELLVATQAALDDLCATAGRAAQARERLLAKTVDLTGWFVRTIESLAALSD